MNWFNQLKMLPISTPVLQYIIINRAEAEKTLKELNDLTHPNDSVRRIFATIDADQPSLEEVVKPLLNTPRNDLTLEEIKEYYVKFKDAMSWMTMKDATALVEEGLEERKNKNFTRVKQILEELDERANLTENKLKKYRDFRDKLDILRLKEDKSYISFKNFPTDTASLEQFAKDINGELKDEYILVNFENRMAFQESFMPKKSRQGKNKGEVIDTQAEIDRKEPISKLYREKIRKYGPQFNVGSQVLDIDSRVADKKNFVSQNRKITVNPNFSGASVLSYIKAIDKTKGSVRAFRPQVLFEKGEDADYKTHAPPNLYLDKSSSNSINLNPYAELLITNVISGDNWFKLLFDTIRKTQLMDIKAAETAVIDDIYNSLKANATTSKLYGIPLRVITDNEKYDYGASKEKMKKLIRAIKKEDNAFDAQILNKTLNLQAEQLDYLQEDDFTIKEAAEYERLFYAEGGKPEEIRIEYFDSGRPAAFKYEEASSAWKKQYNSNLAEKMKEFSKNKTSPQEIEEKLTQWKTSAMSGKNNANHAKISVNDFGNWEQKNPDKVFAEENFTVSTPKESESARSRGSKSAESTKAELKTVEDSRKRIDGSPLKNERGKDITQEQRDNTLEILDTKITRLKSRLSQQEQRLDQGLLQEDIGTKTSKIRNEFLRMPDFAKYVITLAKELENEGGLTSLVNTNLNTASALDQITPKNSLNFLAHMTARVGDDEMTKAFKTIDEDPTSEKALPLAEELNGQIKELLPKMTKAIINAFKIKLEDFAKNVAEYPPKQVMSAIKNLTEFNLITVE